MDNDTNTNPKEECGILLDRKQLKEILATIAGNQGPKGIAFRIHQNSNSEERKKVNASTLDIIPVWFDKTTQNGKIIGLTGEAYQIIISKKVIKKDGSQPTSKEKHWEFADLIKPEKLNPFGFSFFHYSTLHTILEYSPEGFDGIYLGGAKIGLGHLDKNAQGERNPYSNKEVFTFKIEPRTSIKSFSAPQREVFGLPLVAFGFSCPPDWYNGEKEIKRELDKLSETIMSL